MLSFMSLPTYALLKQEMIGFNKSDTHECLDQYLWYLPRSPAAEPTMSPKHAPIKTLAPSISSPQPSSQLLQTHLKTQPCPSISLNTPSVVSPSTLPKGATHWNEQYPYRLHTPITHSSILSMALAVEAERMSIYACENNHSTL